MSDLYAYSAKTLAGKNLDLKDYRGKVVLVVNTASQCGLTPQYAGLEALHRMFHARGLEVLGFPCNQFGAQDRGMPPRSAPSAARTTACRSGCSTRSR